MEKENKNAEKKDFQQVAQVENTPFTILKDLEKEDFIIVMGNAIATHKRYKKLEHAIQDIRKVNWDLIATFFIKMKNYQVNEKEIQEAQNASESNN